MNVEGKIAIVTGAASGIGRATVLALAHHKSAGIVAVDINGDALEALASELASLGVKAAPVAVDLSKTSSVQNVYDVCDREFGHVDIVFNNAGIVSGPPPYPDTSLERIKLVIDINLTSVVQSTALAIQRMAKTGGGVIIQTASMGGVNTSLKSDAGYAATKAGVIHMTRSCAGFYEEFGVRVNAVCPGITRTPILAATGGGEIPEWLKPRLEGRDVMEPEDIARAVINIIADDSMVGENIIINDPNFN